MEKMHIAYKAFFNINLLRVVFFAAVHDISQYDAASSPTLNVYISHINGTCVMCLDIRYTIQVANSNMK